eukprot:COSAG04_NODE_458_length_14025_cov_349.233735_3_plen_105_part_00
MSRTASPEQPEMLAFYRGASEPQLCSAYTRPEPDRPPPKRTSEEAMLDAGGAAGAEAYAPPLPPASAQQVNDRMTFLLGPLNALTNTNCYSTISAAPVAGTAAT